MVVVLVADTIFYNTTLSYLLPQLHKKLRKQALEVIHLIKFQFVIFLTTHNCHDISTKEVRPMSLQCPRCHSPKVASFHHAMKAGAAIGAVGGLARGISAALAGGKAGAALGLIAGPVGITLGSVSGAILGGLAGSVGGCAIGAQLGESLDRHVLAHNLCLLCGHRFNLPT